MPSQRTRIRLIGTVIFMAAAYWLLPMWFYSQFLVHTVRSLSYSPDGAVLAGAGGWTYPHDGDDMGGALWLWDARSGKLNRRISGPFRRLHAVAFSTDGKTVYGWQDDGKQLAWDVETGRATENSGASHQLRNRDMTLRYSERAAVFTGAGLPFVPLPSGNRVARASDVRENGVLFRLQQLLKIYPGESILAVYTGGLSVVTSERHEGSPDAVTHLRKLPDGILVQKFPRKLSQVGPVRFSPDGSLVAFQGRGDNSRQLFLWDVKGRKLRRTLESQIIFALTLVFSPDGQNLTESGLYGDVQVWDTATGRTIIKWTAP